MCDDVIHARASSTTIWLSPRLHQAARGVYFVQSLAQQRALDNVPERIHCLLYLRSDGPPTL